MDIEKDSNREAFELVVANKLQNSLYHSVFFNEATGWYYCADDAPAGVQVFCCDLNSDFRIWQAAKAQAVPEGFVLVSQKELMELAIAINAVDLATHTEEKPNEVREMWQQVALKLGALCSTGASQ